MPSITPPPTYETDFMIQQQQLWRFSLTTSAPSPIFSKFYEEQQHSHASPILLQAPPQQPTILSNWFPASLPIFEKTEVLQQQEQKLAQHPAAFSAPSATPFAAVDTILILQQSLQSPPTEEKQETQHPETFSKPSSTTPPTLATLLQEQIYWQIDPHPIQHFSQNPVTAVPPSYKLAPILPTVSVVNVFMQHSPILEHRFPQ